MKHYTTFFLLALLASCGGQEKPQVAARTAAVPVVYEVPAAIDPTGATDVTDALNAWIQSVPDSSTIAFRGNAIYRAEGGIHFRNRKALNIEGRGARIRSLISGDSVTLTYVAPAGSLKRYRVQGTADTTLIFHVDLVLQSHWPRNRYHVNLEDCQGVTLTGLYVDGPNNLGGPDGEYRSTMEAQHAVNIQRCKDIAIRSCRLEQIWGDAIYVGGNSKRVDLVGNICQQTGRQGMAICWADTVNVIGNYIGKVRRSMIDLETSATTWDINNITIRANTFGSGRLNWIAAGGKAGGYRNTIIENNIILEKSPNIGWGPADTTFRRGPVVIRDNISIPSHGNSFQAAWRFSYTDDITITGNYIPLQANRNMHLVGCTNCSGVSVTGNSWPGGVGDLLGAAQN